MIRNIAKRIIRVLVPVVNIPSRLSVENATNILEEYSNKPSGTCYGLNSIDQEYDLQIIVAVYNAEDTLLECLRSIEDQHTSYKCLVTVVNDGSTDKTAEIIDFCKANWSNDNIELEVVEQQNQGLSGARNAALKHMRGHITFLDADDILMEGCIQLMLDCARKKDTDIVQGNWFEFDEKTSYEHDDIKVDLKSSTEAVLYGYPWGKLFKNVLFKNFQFPEGYWFEDTPLSFMLYMIAEKKETVEKRVYGYRRNPNGITMKSVGNPKSIDSYWITEQCLSEFPKFGLQYNQKSFEYFLQQCRMNWIRTRILPKQIREAVFIKECGLYKQYYLQVRSEKLRDIQRALQSESFIKFEMIMRSTP